MGLLDIDVNEGISDITKVVDDSFESEDERQKQLTERLRLDMTSPHLLPQIIRPASFIWAMSLQTILSLLTIIMAFMSTPTNETSIMAVMGSNTGILMTMVGFYFASRRAEKINAKKVEAAIDINREKARVEIIRDKDIIKLESKKAGIELDEIKAKTNIDIKESKAESRQNRRDDRKERREERRGSK